MLKSLAKKEYKKKIKQYKKYSKKYFEDNAPIISDRDFDLLKKYSINQLDLLVIDAEGYDGDIVIDFLSTITLRPLIIFEYIFI